VANQAQILAVKLFSITPNSMVEEQMISQAGFANNSMQRRQHLDLLRDKLQIKQWIRSKVFMAPILQYIC
jgi:hypothetical protein